MNERIRELIKQAGDYVNEVYTGPVRSKTPGKIWEDGHIDWLTQFNEKFAQLIVRECIDIAINASSDTNFITGISEADKRALSIAVEIRNHFGVEE
jgi:hypothetical protein